MVNLRRRREHVANKIRGAISLASERNFEPDNVYRSGSKIFLRRESTTKELLF